MRTRLATLLLLSLLVACTESDTAIDESYLAAIEAWHEDRLASLKAPDGYLNLAGLFWLDETSSSFGAAPDCDVVFPGTIGRIGEFEIVDGGVLMNVVDGVDVRIDDETVDSVFMPDDLGEETVTATLGALAWTVINREGKLGIRLRDFNHPALDAFPSIPHYAVDADWRVPATLHPYGEPRVMNVDTVIEGLGWNPSSPGIVEFERGGQRHTLEAYNVDGRLFFVFGDRSSGRETYPAGRFLYADNPDADGRTVLDFNRAYNPPCAFNDFSTCPVASARNRLAFAVTAGEQYDRALHVGSGF